MFEAAIWSSGGAKQLSGGLSYSKQKEKQVQCPWVGRVLGMSMEQEDDQCGWSKVSKCRVGNEGSEYVAGGQIM